MKPPFYLPGHFVWVLGFIKDVALKQRTLKLDNVIDLKINNPSINGILICLFYDFLCICQVFTRLKNLR